MVATIPDKIAVADFGPIIDARLIDNLTNIHAERQDNLLRNLQQRDVGTVTEKILQTPHICIEIDKYEGYFIYFSTQMHMKAFALDRKKNEWIFIVYVGFSAWL